MLATVPSATLVGIDGHAVTVEVHIGRGLPSFTVVGLPDAACREARDRVRAAFASPELAATFLIINGLLLFAGERLKSRGSGTLDELGWPAAIGIGLAQCLAFIPGLSRSGATLVAGLSGKVDDRVLEAARYQIDTLEPMPDKPVRLAVPDVPLASLTPLRRR